VVRYGEFLQDPKDHGTGTRTKDDFSLNLYV
jgi:hypothetical protein